MAIQIYMRAFNTATGQYVDWVVNDQPDTAGIFAPGGPANLTNIVVNKSVQSKINNFLKSVVEPSYIQAAYSNPQDGYLFHLNSYDWLNPAVTGPITIPSANQPIGISVVRGSASGGSPFIPSPYASIFWEEGLQEWVFAYINTNGTIGAPLGVSVGPTNIIGYLSVQDVPGNPEASTGLIRLPNNQFIEARNAANNGDIMIVGTDNMDHVIVGDSTHNTVVAGNLVVLGATTDTASRVIHVNWQDPNLVVNAPVPSLITGYDVHRGNTLGVANDASAMLWQEGNLLSGADGYWVFATIPQDNDNIGYNGLGVPLNVMAKSICIAPTTSVLGNLALLAGEGALRTENNIVAVAARNAASNADIMLLATDGYNNIIIGNSTTTSNSTNVYVTGNLNVLGTTTTIDSVVVDIEGRVIHGNWAPASANLLPPTQISGYSVNRGAAGGVFNDSAALVWIEGTDVTHATDGFWLTATITQDNDNTTQAGLPNILKTMTGGIYVSSTPDPSLTSLPTVGGLRTQNNTPAVTARDFTGTLDIHMLSTDSSNHIIHGGKVTVNNTGHIFSTLTGGIYDFQVGGVSQVQIAQNNIIFANTDGYAAITQASTASISGATMTIAAQAALGALGIGGDLILAAGHGTLIDGYVDVQGSLVNLISDGYVVASAEPNKFAFVQGRRRHITQVFDDGYIFGGQSYYEVQLTDDYIAFTGLNAPLAVIMPSNPTLGDAYQFKDTTGLASTFNITVFGNGNNIDNSPTFIANSSYQGWILTYTGSSWSLG